MQSIAVWNFLHGYDKYIGSCLFENAEFYKSLEELNKSSKKKVVILDNWMWSKHLSSSKISIDFSKIDLIIFLDSEYINSKLISHYDYYHYLVDKLNNKNIIFTTGEYLRGDYYGPLSTRFFYPYLSFFHKVLAANDDIKYSLTNARPYIFDALLGGKKDHRLYTFELLKKYKLLESSLVSLTAGPYDNEFSSFRESWGITDVPDYESPELYKFEEPDITDFKRNSTTVLEKYSGNFLYTRRYKNYQDGINSAPPMSVIVPTTIYKNSWYSIVSETNFASCPFLTEKTVKPLFARRLFITFSFCGHLKFLKELGFETFSRVLDESYDNEPDHIKRFNLAGEQMLFLSRQDPVKIYKKIKPELDYNNHLLKTLVEKNLKNIRSFVKLALGP